MVLKDLWSSEFGRWRFLTVQDLEILYLVEARLLSSLNSLPSALCNGSLSLNTFEWHLKNHLFTQSWTSPGAVMASCDSGAAVKCHNLLTYLLPMIILSSVMTHFVLGLLELHLHLSVTRRPHVTLNWSAQHFHHIWRSYEHLFICISHVSFEGSINSIPDFLTDLLATGNLCTKFVLFHCNLLVLSCEPEWTGGRGAATFKHSGFPPSLPSFPFYGAHGLWAQSPPPNGVGVLWGEQWNWQ